MAIVDIPWNPPPRTLRQFAALQLVFFAAVAAWLYFRHAQSLAAGALLAASLAAAAVGAVRPAGLRWFFVGWMLAVFPIGWIVSHTALLLTFYLVFVPVGLIMKLCGYDPLERRLDRNAESYWKPRPAQEDTERYFKQY